MHPQCPVSPDKREPQETLPPYRIVYGIISLARLKKGYRKKRVHAVRAAMGTMLPGSGGHDEQGDLPHGCSRGGDLWGSTTVLKQHVPVSADPAGAPDQTL
jgi:hypothetical protein